MTGGGSSLSPVRNRLDQSPVYGIAIIGAAVIAAVVVMACLVSKNKDKEANKFNAEQETNANLYFTDGVSMSGGELVDTMSKLSGTSVCFSVKTLSSDEPTYYNRDTDGNEVPVYIEPDNKSATEYIRNLGVFEIHIKTGENGQKIVSATQTK